MEPAAVVPYRAPALGVGVAGALVALREADRAARDLVGAGLADIGRGVGEAVRRGINELAGYMAAPEPDYWALEPQARNAWWDEQQRRVAMDEKVDMELVRSPPQRKRVEEVLTPRPVKRRLVFPRGDVRPPWSFRKRRRLARRFTYRRR